MFPAGTKSVIFTVISPALGAEQVCSKYFQNELGVRSEMHSKKLVHEDSRTFSPPLELRPQREQGVKQVVTQHWAKCCGRGLRRSLPERREGARATIRETEGVDPRLRPFLSVPSAPSLHSSPQDSRVGSLTANRQGTEGSLLNINYLWSSWGRRRSLLSNKLNSSCCDDTPMECSLHCLKSWVWGSKEKTVRDKAVNVEAMA